MISLRQGGYPLRAQGLGIGLQLLEHSNDPRGVGDNLLQQWPVVYGLWQGGHVFGLFKCGLVQKPIQFGLAFETAVPFHTEMIHDSGAPCGWKMALPSNKMRNGVFAIGMIFQNPFAIGAGHG